MLTGSRPLGLTRPLSTPAIAGAPSSPGKNVCTIAAASVAAPTERVRAAGQQRDDGRRAGVEHRIQQLLLGAGQPQRVRVAAFAAGAAAEQAGPVAEGQDDHARHRAASEQRPRRIRRCRAPSIVRPGTYPVHLAAGELRPQRVEQRGQLDAERHLRVLHADVGREGVAAEQRDTGRRRSGRSPRSTRGASAAAAGRRCAAGRPPLGDAAGELPVVGADPDRRCRGTGQRIADRSASRRAARHRRPVRVEQAEFDLLRSTRRSAVDRRPLRSSRPVGDRRPAAARRTP